MNKIIVVMSPTDIWHGVFVYKNNDLVFRKEALAKDLKALVPELVETYGVFEVSFSGAKAYTKKFGDEVQREFTTKYQENNKVTVSYV